MLTIQDIQKMELPGELFSGNADQIRQQYVRLMKQFHPDVNGASAESYQAAAKINRFYQEVSDHLERGIWVGAQEIRFEQDGQWFAMAYGEHVPFELGDFYIGSNSILYLFEKDSDDLTENAIRQAGTLRFADERMEREFAKYLPEFSGIYRTRGGHNALLAKRPRDSLCLKSIIGRYGTIGAEHAAWIMSGLYNLICFFQYNGIVHNGITEENIFVSLKSHLVWLPGGWWHAGRRGEKLRSISAALYQIMPMEGKRTECCMHRMDLESVRRLGRVLTGDDGGIRQRLEGRLPAPFIEWICGVAGDDAWTEFEEWYKVIEKAFGGRRFTEWNL